MLPRVAPPSSHLVSGLCWEAFGWLQFAENASDAAHQKVSDTARARVQAPPPQLDVNAPDLAFYLAASVWPQAGATSAVQVRAACSACRRTHSSH